jgi:hypothetical protein
VFEVVWAQRTDDYVGFRSSVLNDGCVVERAIDKFGVGVLVLDRLGTLLITYEQGELILGMSLGNVRMGSAPDVS